VDKLDANNNNLTIHEGTVTIKVPEFEKVSAKAPVFYNPVMELNRDISVAALTVFSINHEKDINICDSFGGTGIRGIRYAKELNGVENVVITDLNPLAVQFAEENIKNNQLENVRVFREDANIMLRKCKGKFDVVDIDPFGTPAPYVESAAAGLRAGGMLCVTATDTSSLCGTYTEPCIRKYGAKPLKTEYCHENGIRILAGFVARTFAKYKKYVDIRFSHSTEHYMRIYVTVGKGAKKTDESLKNLGYVAHCDSCLKRMVIKGMAPQIPSECPVCGGSLNVGGPLWCGPIVDRDFTASMMEVLPQINVKERDKILKLLKTCYEEASAPATYYDLHMVCKNLKISAPPLLNVLEMLKNSGYFVSRTHFEPTGIKTDAPIEELKKIVLNAKKSSIKDSIKS
jgi:tRNA (guanine26-N2/guanine27-N2)-dimethyltransferase